MDDVYGDLSSYEIKDLWGDLSYSLKDRYFELYDCLMYMGMYDYETKLGITANPTDAADKVLFADLGVDDYIRYSRESEDKKAWTDKIFLTFDVYFDATCMSNAFLETQIKLEGRALNTILKFDFGYGDIYYNEENPTITGPVVWYAPWDANTKNFSTQYTTIEGFSPKVDTWYSVAVCFNAEDEICSFDIIEGEEKVAEVSYAIPGANGISAFECKGAFSRYETMFWEYIDDPENPIHAKMYIDDMEIYEGSYKRTPSEKESISEITLKEIADFYKSEACSREDKVVIAGVFYELLGYDAEAILGYVPEAWEYVNLTYANEIIARTAAIDKTANYYDRINYIETQVAPFNDKIAAGVITELIGVSAEIVAEINVAREAIAAEMADLGTIKAHSEGFIEAIKAYVPENRNYDAIVACYVAVTDDNYKLRSPDYVGVAEAEEIFAKIEFKYNRMIADTEAFVAAVTELKSKEANFGAYFSAYTAANTLYCKYDEMPEYANGAFITPDADIYDVPADDEYVASEKVIAVRAAIEYFLTNEETILANAALCDAFNMAVLKAYASDYFPTTSSLIDAADAAYAAIAENFEYLKDYEGIEVEKTLVDTVAALADVKAGKRDEKLAATALYIDAVNKIDAAEGFYAKREAVKDALALKGAGDNLAIAGVLEANLKLTAAEAEVNEAEGNSKSVIALVAKLEGAKTISERRDIIRQINEHVEGVANDYEGVTAAIASFETLLAAFNADVAEANRALMSAIKNAVKF